MSSDIKIMNWLQTERKHIKGLYLFKYIIHEK